MMDWPQTSISAAIGAVLIAATVLLRREIRRTNGNGSAFYKRIEDMSSKLDRLYDMHNVRDQNGRYLWYVPPNFDRRLERLLEATEKNAQTTERLVEAVKRLCDHVAQGD